MITWPSYSYGTPIFDAMSEQICGIVGIRNSILCYKPYMCFASKAIMQDANILLNGPDANAIGMFTIGEAYLQSANKSVLVTITGIDYTNKLIAISDSSVIPAGGFYVTQYGLGGGSVYTGSVTKIGSKTYQLIINDLYCYGLFGDVIYIPSYSTYLSSSKFYIFATYSGVVVTTGATKKLGELTVDDIPAGPIIGVVNGGTLDADYNGFVMGYKMQDEFVGATSDRTGRLTCICHKSSGNEVAMYSEDMGRNWVWGRVDS